MYTIDFDYKLVTLLVVAILNILMSAIVISRGIKNKVNLFFGLFTFFSFLWSLSLFFGKGLNTSAWEFWALFAYIAAIGIGLAVFYFSFYFPYKKYYLKKYQSILIILPAVIFTAIIYIPNYFIVNAQQDNILNEYILYYQKPIYILYGLYFLLLTFWAVYNLFIKYKNSEGLLNKQVKLLLSTIVIGLIFASYFDLIICYFENFRYVWIGPIFTLFINMTVFYLIFFSKEK